MYSQIGVITPGFYGETVSQPFLSTLLWFPSCLPNVKGSLHQFLIPPRGNCSIRSCRFSVSVGGQGSGSFCVDVLNQNLPETKHVCTCLVTQSCPTLRPLGAVSLQAPLSMGFSRQEYWSGLPCPSPGDLPDSGIAGSPPALQAY